MLLESTHRASLSLPSEESLNGRRRPYASAITLAIAAPVIAELISSSAPPFSFFVPWVFALFVVFYGGSALLIRELTVRWGKGWKSILLLGAGFGILLEGISTRAFFDPVWSSLGPMVNHGRSLGVNWIWSIDAIVYHATFSTALPILLVYQLFPNSSRTLWLSNRLLWTTAVLWALGGSVFVYSGRTRYPAPLADLWGCVAVIVVLFALARYLPVSLRTPRGAPDVKPLSFVLLGFGATLGQVCQIYVVPSVAHSPLLTACVLAAIVLVSATLLFSWTNGGGDWTALQQCALLVGALGCFALMGFFQEVNPSRTRNTTGTSVVGLLTLIGLYRMWRRARLAVPPVAPSERRT